MRLVANAKYVVFEPAQSLAEHYLISNMLWGVRKKSLPDLKAIGAEFARDNNLPYMTNMQARDVGQSINPCHSSVCKRTQLHTVLLCLDIVLALPHNGIRVMVQKQAHNHRIAPFYMLGARPIWGLISCCRPSRICY